MVRIMPLRRYYRRRDNIAHSDRSHLVGASVVIFAGDDYSSLAEMLTQVLNQEYAPGFEVIVVGEEDSSSVRAIVEQLIPSYPNLYFTAAPEGARNLSRKKLALTLGIKAAKNPIIVNTTTSARIKSRKWLYNIMRHFDPEGATDVVLGYAAAPPYEDRSFGARARSFDSVIDAFSWIGAATAGHPWRGIEHNLAFRRDMFFRVKGFSHHLNLRYGDDDIFVSEISRGFNTVVELSDDSFVEVPGSNTRRALNEQSARRHFTKRFIKRRPRFIGSICSLLYMVAPLPLFVVPFTGNMDWLSWTVLSFILICWYAEGLLWNSVVRILKGRRLFFSTPFLFFTRPVRILTRALRGRIHPGKRYTWE